MLYGASDARVRGMGAASEPAPQRWSRLLPGHRIWIAVRVGGAMAGDGGGDLLDTIVVGWVVDAKVVCWTPVAERLAGIVRAGHGIRL